MPIENSKSLFFCDLGPKKCVSGGVETKNA
jgi:hypothetical protein